MNRILIIVFLGFGTINLKNVFFPVLLLEMMIVLQQFHKFSMPIFFLKEGIEKKERGSFQKERAKIHSETRIW